MAHRLHYPCNNVTQEVAPMKLISLIAFTVVLGLVWTGAVIPAEVKDKAADVSDKARDTAETTKDKVKNTADQAKDKAESAGEKVKEKATEAKDKVKEKATELTDKAKDAMHRDKTGRTSPSDVQAAQEALKAKGIDPGPIDGVMGPKTHAAVSDFQRQEGLKVTGNLDRATRTRLLSGTSSSPSATPSTQVSKEGAASPSTDVKDEGGKRQRE
jgi:hypothetical protein